MIIIDAHAIVAAMWDKPTQRERAMAVILPSSERGWARYCINHGVSLPVYAAGFALINGSDGVAWLSKGFEAILDESVKAPILPHSDRRNVQ